MVVNVFLFDDFEVMDAFGPVQVFGCTRNIFIYDSFPCAEG